MKSPVSKTQVDADRVFLNAVNGLKNLLEANSAVLTNGHTALQYVYVRHSDVDSGFPAAFIAPISASPNAQFTYEGSRDAREVNLVITCVIDAVNKDSSLDMAIAFADALLTVLSLNTQARPGAWDLLEVGTPELGMYPDTALNVPTVKQPVTVIRRLD